MWKDLLEDVLGDVVSDGLWQAMRGAPAWVYYLLSAALLGAAAFLYFAMNQSFWTWPTLLLAVIVLLFGIFGS